MEFLKLIAMGLQNLVEMPILLVRTIVEKVRYTGRLTSQTTKELKGPLKPVSGIRKFFRALWKISRWLFVIVIVVGVFFGLGYLNFKLDLERALGGPWLALRRIWLPYLFFLFCLLCLLGWWLWKLLGPERETADFPDIAEAWTEACLALDKAGIDLTSVPVFLVCGWPAAGMDFLFSGAQMPFLVRQVPRRANAPLQVYANREAIFLTCPGASLLGRHAALLAGETDPDLDKVDLSPRTESIFEAGDEPANSPPALPPPSGSVEGEENLLAEVYAPAPGSEAALESPQTSLLLAPEEPVPAPQPRRRPSLLKNTTEAERQKERLQYLCRLLRRARQPFCPVNGILLLVPFAATDNDDDASQTGLICRHDLAAARAMLKTDCPLLALVSDLERVPGFREFLEFFPVDQRQRLLGQGFPLRPDLKPAEVPAMIESGVTWISRALAALVYKRLRLEKPGQESVNDVVRVNARLYQFFAVVQERQQRLARLISRLAVLDPDTPLPFGGCYFGATGPEADREQAFVAGVFRRLLENQNAVAWTPEALAEEADYQRWTFYGYAGLAMFFLAVVFLGIWKWRR